MAMLKHSPRLHIVWENQYFSLISFHFFFFYFSAVWSVNFYIFRISFGAVVLQYSIPIGWYILCVHIILLLLLLAVDHWMATTRTTKPNEFTIWIEPADRRRVTIKYKQPQSADEAQLLYFFYFCFVCSMKWKKNKKLCTVIST